MDLSNSKWILVLHGHSSFNHFKKKTQLVSFQCKALLLSLTEVERFTKNPRTTFTLTINCHAAIEWCRCNQYDESSISMVWVLAIDSQIRMLRKIKYSFYVIFKQHHKYLLPPSLWSRQSSNYNTKLKICISLSSL